MSEPFRVLFVCTGNICRSPAAEHLLRTALRQRLGGEASILVASAGTHALVGWPTDPPTAAALLLRQIDPGDHLARTLTAAEVAQADLVLGATRAHRAAAVTLYPRAVRYSYTVCEFARLAGSVIDRPDYVPQSLPALLDDVRSVRGIVRAADPHDDDVADPYGHRDDAHGAAVAAIATATEVIADALARAIAQGPVTGRRPASGDVTA